MKYYPKQINQKNYMGKKCFFDGEYYRDYGLAKESHSEFSTYKDSKVPVKWEIDEHGVLEGWIVGFGFVFNGTIETEVNMGGDNYKSFVASKRVNYVRVRITPSGKELKIPFKNVRLQSEK